MILNAINDCPFYQENKIEIDKNDLKKLIKDNYNMLLKDFLNEHIKDFCCLLICMSKELYRELDLKDFKNGIFYLDL
jgi:hypothetical protein